MKKRITVLFQSLKAEWWEWWEWWESIIKPLRVMSRNKLRSDFTFKEQYATVTHFKIIMFSVLLQKWKLFLL